MPMQKEAQNSVLTDHNPFHIELPCWTRITQSRTYILLLLILLDNHSVLSFRVEHVSCHAEDFPTAIQGIETFCDVCKKRGVPKKTANVYCTYCKKKYCANHAEVSIMYIYGLMR